ncbi:MAG: hypothetical protein KDD46_00890 [Bdellovibrionales bacterium]|nr:hypothetical protein [Bdellovibrionales bacterium]
MFIICICFALLQKTGLALEKSPYALSQEKLFTIERQFGAPYPELRLSDQHLFTDAYAQGGDLFQQFIRFLFPISGREKRTPFLSAPYWGVKKPRFKKFEWERFESDHYDFYTYPEGQQSLQQVIRFFEEEYERNNRIFGVQNRFEKKIPIVFYQSRRDFEQSSIVDGPIPEGLGGLTEIFGWKRVTFPFEGENEKFEHVTKHEATHIFQIEKGSRRLPLWFIEGSAETNSIYWDADAEMVIRDAYLNGFFYPIRQLWQIQGTWLMYKIGNYISNMIWDEYGEEGFFKIFDNANVMNFEDNIEASLGVMVSQLEQKVQAKLLLDYGSLLKQQDVVDESESVQEKRIVLDSFKNFYVTGGNVGAQNALFLTYRYEHDAEEIKLVMDREYENESLESFRKGADISDRHVVYSIKRSKQDELRVQEYDFNSESKKITLGQLRKYRWNEIDKIEHPVLTGSNEVYFIGYQQGFSNLYKANLKKGTFKKITEDNRHYDHLDYCPKDQVFVFSREDERDSSVIHYQRNLYIMNRKAEIDKLTNNPAYVHIEPSFSESCNEILFVSDWPSTYNLFSYNRKTKETQVLTNVRVGVRHPFWGPDNTIYYNAYKEMTPTMYQTRFPNLKDIVQRSVRSSKDFSVPLNITQKKSAVSARPVHQDLSAPVLDGLYSYKSRSMIQQSGRPYSVEAFSPMDDRIVVRTSEGLPESGSVRVNRFPYYYEVKGNQIQSLQSNMVATKGVSDPTLSWIKTKLQGQGVVDAWTSVDDKKIFVVVNNRLANDYKEYKSFNELGLYIYDEEKNHLDALPEGPVFDLDQNVQWVSFLKNGYVLIVVAEQKTGPYRVIIYDTSERQYYEMSQDASRFTVSEDRSKMVWKSSNYMFLNFEEQNPTPKKIKIDEGKIKSLSILHTGSIGFVAVDQDSMIWIEIDPKTMAPIQTKKQSIKDEKIEDLIIHQSGFVVASTKGFAKDSKYNLWVWDLHKDKTFKVRQNQAFISQPIARGSFVTFVEKYFQAQPSREFIFHVDSPLEVFEFEPEIKSVLIENNTWVVEGKRSLIDYDLSSNETSIVAKDSIGFDSKDGKIYYSEESGSHFAIKVHDTKTKQNRIVRNEDRHLIKPVMNQDDLNYLAGSTKGWEVRNEQNDNSIDLQTVDIIELEKVKDDQVYAYAKVKHKQNDRQPQHEISEDYPRMYLARPAGRSLKLQSLAAAAAYDGDTVRLLVSGFADNLFGDKGVFVNSILLSDTKFATIGFTDLSQGYSTSFFYNQRQSIDNYGLNFTKDIIMDRYRQISMYSEFEIQSYGSDSSARNAFLSPSFDGNRYYLAKLGSIYAFDITVNDLHGPVSGQRLYFRSEAGLDLEKGRVSNYDINGDIRLYHRILPKFGFAHRLVGGTSQGPIPNIYLLGGNPSFRGVGFDDLEGQNYWVFSEDMRIPVFDFIGAKLFDPLDQMLGFLTRYFDVRSGIYADVGAVWNNVDPADMKYSVGYFINIPTVFGLMIRLHDGLWGEKKFGVWIGTNW